MIAKIKFYSILTIIVTLIGIIAYQQFRSWLGGIESSVVQSVYRKKPARMTAKPLDPPKGSQAVTRPVKGFVAKPGEHGEASAGNSFTIGRWKLENIPCNRDVVVEVVADEGGDPSMSYEIQKDGLAELGYLRELALYYSRSVSLADQLEASMEMGLEYSHDLFRLGPVWVSGRVSGGWERLSLPNGETIDGAKVTAVARAGVRF